MAKLFSCGLIASLTMVVLALSSPLAAQDQIGSEFLTIQAEDGHGHPRFLLRNSSGRTVVVKVSIERIGLFMAVSRSGPSSQIKPVTLMIAPWKEYSIELSDTVGTVSTGEYLVQLEQLPILYSAPGSRRPSPEMDLSAISMSFAFRPRGMVTYADAGGAGQR
ncbi:MAG: hypothetical protein HWE25_00845 [Alphaproteobacteria bacterium]|nr:hypothetical protein [Alphaproteobacteria bacterium]